MDKRSYGENWVKKITYDNGLAKLYKKIVEKMLKIFDKVIKFIKETLKNWKVELTAEGKKFAEVKIQRGIFHGDA